MTALNPEDRYETPDEVLHDIENYLAKMQTINSIRRLKTAFLMEHLTIL